MRKRVISLSLFLSSLLYSSEERKTGEKKKRIRLVQPVFSCTVDDPTDLYLFNNAK